jgi:hypothetical protein
MAREETPNQDLSQAGSFFPDLDALYESVIDDALLNGPARIVRIHLTPILSAASGTTPINPQAHEYNPFMRQAFRPAPIERYTGTHKETRYVEYKANVRHGPADLQQGSPVGRLEANDVQTTTVIGAEQDIRNAISMEVDGKRYKLSAGPRPIGWQSAKYLITVWREIQAESEGTK